MTQSAHARRGRSGCSIPSLGGACAWVTRCLAQSHTNDVVRDDPGCGPPDRHGPADAIGGSDPRVLCYWALNLAVSPCVRSNG